MAPEPVRRRKFPSGRSRKVASAPVMMEAPPVAAVQMGMES